MNFTTLVQSKHLLKLGLNPETADMHYGNFSMKGLGYAEEFKPGLTSYSKAVETYEENKKYFGIDNYDGIVAWEVLPCWSVETLLKIIPFPILWMECLAGTFLWKCSTTTIEEGKVQEVVGETLLEAVYNMIVWLFENNYIKKGE